MDKRFWAIIGVIVAVFVGIVAFRGSDGGTSTNADPTNHVIGKLDSKVTLVEYGDYQCPVCEGYYQTVKDVQAKYNDQIKFQFRNLPLTQNHKNAQAAARTAEAADLQGKFWEMHDALYEPNNWQAWSESNNPVPLFEAYAKQLGLNMTQFKKDFASRTVNDRIQADVAAFNKTGQEMGTPTFFVNGKYVPNGKFVVNGLPSVDAFSKIIDEALKNAGS